MMVAFFLVMLNLSIKNINDGSIIETADVIPANTKATKKDTAIICPKIPQPEKITGSEMNTRPGPAALGAPASNKNVKIISPETKAISVSMVATVKDVFTKLTFLGSDAE